MVVCVKVKGARQVARIIASKVAEWGKNVGEYNYALVISDNRQTIGRFGNAVEAWWIQIDDTAITA